MDAVTGEQRQLAQVDRQAVNTVIQGSASDIIKQAMLEVESQLSASWPNLSSRPKILLQLHDELIYEMKVDGVEGDIDNCKDISLIYMNEEVQNFVNILKNCMEQLPGWDVPMPTNVQVGFNWGELHSIPNMK